MRQPELGKKIADLRKERGLTQEELVTMCNLNVRTLQRIESGEVMPRNYTVKTIFTALEYDLRQEHSVTEGTFGGNNEDNVRTGLSGFFNLSSLSKFRIMQAFLVLSVISLAIGLLSFSQNKKEITGKQIAHSITGTWVLCDSLGQELPYEEVIYKIITPESVEEVRVNTKKRNFKGVSMGEYSLKGSIYEETICFGNRESMTGKECTMQFSVEVKGELLYLKGIRNPYNQVWKRVKSL